jgi:hypothetical protein
MASVATDRTHGYSGLKEANRPWSFAYSCFTVVLDMPAKLPLNEMSLEEKLQAMEALWEDLSREPDRIESPSWHEDVLKETQRRVESGEATFSDWEEAKVSVRDRL